MAPLYSLNYYCYYTSVCVCVCVYQVARRWKRDREERRELGENNNHADSLTSFEFELLAGVHQTA